MNDVTWQAVIAAVVTLVLAWMQSRTKKAVADASVKSSEDAGFARAETQNVRETLAQKHEDISGRLGEIHTLVNDRLGVALRVAATALRRLADQTGSAADRESADKARRQLDEHDARQAELDRLRMPILLTSDAIYRKDLDGVITGWSPACERLFGWTAADVLGRPTVEHLIPPDLRHEHDETIARARDGQSTSLDTDRMMKDGRRIRVGLTTTPVRDPSGTIVGVSTLARRST